MFSQSVSIVEFPKLYNILKEIESLFKFNINNYQTVSDFINLLGNNNQDISNSIIILEKKNNQLSSLNQINSNAILIFDKQPFKINQFIDIVNTQLMFPEELGGYKVRSESGTTLVDEDNVNEAPESSYNILVCESEDNVSISEIKSEELTLVKMVDILGRKQQEHKKGSLLFYIYDNGKVEKKFNP